MQQGTAPSSAKAAYRLLMRTVQTTFNRDQRAIQLARQKARAEFQKNAHLTDENAIQDALKMAADVAGTLRRNVAQAVAKSEQPHVYRIEIDPTRHELGDNDDRFQAKPVQKRSRRGCCSQ